VSLEARVGRLEEAVAQMVATTRELEAEAIQLRKLLTDHLAREVA
jgi:hypothetical protein